MISLDMERKSSVIFQRENINWLYIPCSLTLEQKPTEATSTRQRKKTWAKQFVFPQTALQIQSTNKQFWPQNNKQLQKDCFLETVLDETSREKAAFQGYLSKDFLSIPDRNIDCFMQICLIWVEFLEYFRFLFF